MIIQAKGTHYKVLDEAVRLCQDDVVVLLGVNGQRYIGAGLTNKTIAVQGTPGNALGAYLDGAFIEVFGNAQDATGDTMNDGTIVIYGSSGDATGYAMRGGMILVEGDAGYRAGIHMKEYDTKLPVIVIGGSAGSFLGEYQAGGVIVVLGIGKEHEMPVGNFCGTGMHGGRIILQCEHTENLPAQVNVRRAASEEVAPFIDVYCAAYPWVDAAELKGLPYVVLTPNTSNPYTQLYAHI